MWGDLHRILEYSEGVYQDIIRKRNNYIRVRGGDGMAKFPDPYTVFHTMCTCTILFLLWYECFVEWPPSAQGISLCLGSHARTPSPVSALWEMEGSGSADMNVSSTNVIVSFTRRVKFRP